MAVNTMTFNQLATVLNSIVSQATGKTALTATDVSSFVSVAKTGLETGYDPLSTAISQVLSRTIFSVRPYSRKFKGIEADRIQYGNHVRKINYVDKDFEDAEDMTLTDGYSIDMYKVNKPKVIQTNFYGLNEYQKTITIYKDQLDCAFSGPEEFQQFLAGVMQNAQDLMEQARENTARATVANLIAGTYYLDNQNVTSDQVIHLITEYNAHTGDSVTAATVFNPEIFPNFAKWLQGRIQTLSKMFTERTYTHHLNLTAGNIARHTPVEDQRLFLLGGYGDQLASNVLSSVFNTEYLKTIPYEEVMFWQSIQSPDAIKMTAGYTSAAGAAASASVDISKVWGVLMDREAAGYTIADQYSGTTPFNVLGRYYNWILSEKCRYYADNTEKAVVLMLD